MAVKAFIGTSEKRHETHRFMIISFLKRRSVRIFVCSQRKILDIIPSWEYNINREAVYMIKYISAVETAKRRNISRRRTIVLKASGTSAQTVREEIIPDSATVLHHDP